MWSRKSITLIAAAAVPAVALTFFTPAFIPFVRQELSLVRCRMESR